MNEDAYTIDGAEVHVSIWCRADQTRTAIYTLTATDGQARRYALGYDPAAYHVATGGLTAVEGSEIEWLQHEPGDRATISISGGPCEGLVPRLTPIYRAFMPTIIMD